MTKNNIPLHRILLAFIVLPVTVTVFIPILLHTCMSPLLTGPLFHFPGQVIVAVVLALVGITLLYSTNLLFAKEGRGTLAPWAAPEKLVIKGPYRYMRQPMIAGVMLILTGELFYLASWASLIWFFLFVIANLIYIPLLEEKKLEQRFGDQ